MMRLSCWLAIGAIAALVPAAAPAQTEFITIASTTSTKDSGLFAHILPRFQAATGVEARVVAQGTGQALDTARRGDADIVFVHAKALEDKFVADGHGVERFDVMYNDFVIVGPKHDPASIRGLKDAVAAFRAIKGNAAPFVSRGDRSGTHEAERHLWRLAEIEILRADKATWYREIGQGMGAALNMAAELNAYVLADRGTWLAFKNRRELVLLVEGDRRLINQYGVILVNPDKHPHVKAKLAQRFIDWIRSAAGQKAIAEFRIGGEQLFFPNAIPGGGGS